MFGPRLGQSAPTDDSWIARALADHQRQLTQLGASPIITVAVPVMAPTDVTVWPGTGAAAWTPIAETYATRQNPALRWRINTYVPAGTSAQFRLIAGGVQLDAVETVNGTQTLWIGSDTLPASIAYNADYLITLQARVTAGSGTARAQALLLSGAQD